MVRRRAFRWRRVDRPPRRRRKSRPRLRLR
jgi:hypothetical protein